MGKILRASVMSPLEWDKEPERDPVMWERIRQQVFRRDDYTCVYCGWRARRFQQVNHIGAEDNHDLDNLETVCHACHAVLHLGVKSTKEHLLSVFDCKPELTNMAVIVQATRKLLGEGLSWPNIQRRILREYRLPGGRRYTFSQTGKIANEMLLGIPEGEYRGYLPAGRAILFHASAPWHGDMGTFSERERMWQLLNY